MTKSTILESTKRLMGTLVRMKPKPHEDMKLARSKALPKPSASKSKKQKSQ